MTPVYKNNKKVADFDYKYTENGEVICVLIDCEIEIGMPYEVDANDLELVLMDWLPDDTERKPLTGKSYYKFVR